MGEYHVGVLSDIHEAELVGVVDSDQKRAKIISERYKTSNYKDYKELFKKVDAVVVSVPTFHALFDCQRIHSSRNSHSIRKAMYK